MNPDRPRKIGFDRKLDRDWLDATAGRLASGATPQQVREAVYHLLEGILSGDAANSARGKTLTVLSAIWLTVPAAIEPLRVEVLARFNEVTPDERLALHWTMMLAAYPFFLDVAAQTGKLFSLNGDCTLAQIQRRMVDRWGERSTLTRAVQRVLRSMVGWGALQEGTTAGVYQPRPQRISATELVTLLLLEGLLHAEGHGLNLEALTGHPALFPFDLHLNPLVLRQQPRLRVHRQGDQRDWVEIISCLL
ncbi:MAG TPA: hypothetical protein P5102_05545 [Candidatus Competibacteraceae bacterium]|nr:hypothetical protein [Candidatus Competibacteraceae bacterium]HRZ05607.1 hypothetical protein [Candidatus Competibacteraceae bacterium]HSA46516.1 hypothetical protein [Candidatus Competibacteraceae bacterium]